MNDPHPDKAPVLGMPFLSKPIPDPDLNNALFNEVPHWIPLYETHTEIGLGYPNATPPDTCTLEQKSGKTIRTYLIPEDDYNKALFSGQRQHPPLHERLIANALIENATDIHLSETPKGMQSQYRCHGQLHEHYTFDPRSSQRLAQLICFHAHLNDEEQGPQDGRLHYHNQDQHVDIRVASIPSYHGKDFALRLNSNTQNPQLDQLGMSPQIQEQLEIALEQESGLLLITGPTGSGKSSTLYACLNHLIAKKRGQVVTLEDPIEQEIKGARQSQIQAKQDYHFDKGLKAILRQDPDIIMIGEIRDKKTAQIALEAAHTGHLVLSSLHTSTTTSSLLRLLNFDLDPFLIRHSLNAIISQRLQPQYCPHCVPVPQKKCHYCHEKRVIGRHLKQEFLALPDPNSAYALTDLLKDPQLGSFIPFESEDRYQ